MYLVSQKINKLVRLFPSYFGGDKICELLFDFCLPSLYLKGPTLKGKNLLHREQIFSFYSRPHPEIINLFLMFNSAENEICSAYKKLNTSNLNFLSAQQN